MQLSAQLFIRKNSNFFKKLSIVLVLSMLLGCFPLESANAALSSVDSPNKVKTFTSTEDFDGEVLHAKVLKDGRLKIQYRTILPSYAFVISLYRIDADSKDIKLNIVVPAETSLSENETMYYSFTGYLNAEQYGIYDGKYNLYLKRFPTMEAYLASDFSQTMVLYKNMEVQVSDFQFKILQYNQVIDYNRSIQEIGNLYSPSLYLDDTLSDISFVLRNPATGYYATMTYDKINFIQRISNRVVAGATTDMQRLQKIYEYTAANFYYDSIAFSTHSNQFADPYDNIFHFEYGMSSANSQQGRVYTTCQGFSAIFLSLARAQNIPTRFVYGHRLAVPSNDWQTEKNIDVRDHWWCECYVDGHWIFVDPTVGTTNKYNKNTDEWKSVGLTNYTYFAPSKEQIATSHVYMNIYPDYRLGKYLDNPYEVVTLGNFLNQISGASSFGKLMNADYSHGDLSTWGDGIKSHFMTDGCGNTAKIQWNNKGFGGNLSLPGFEKMTTLSAHSNALTGVNLSGCKTLKNIYLYDNQLTSVDLSDCPKLSYVRVQNNPMTHLTMYLFGKNRSFDTYGNGTFYFTFDKRYQTQSFSLYSRPDIGYRLKGIYSTSTGNFISKKTTYHFTPKASGYDIVFCLDPDSYRYYLKPGEISSKKLPYFQAAVQRLEELGYYVPAFYAKETDYFSESLSEAVIKFQVIHNLTDSGCIGEKTWALLFSESARPMVSDWEYSQIHEQYEEKQAQITQAKELLANVKVTVTSQAESGAIRLYWNVDSLTSGEGSEVLEGSQLLESSGTLEVSSSLIPPFHFEIWKSKSKSSGYVLLKESEKYTFKNTSSLVTGTRYYYKVRPYLIVDDTKVYGAWSNITYRKAK